MRFLTFLCTTLLLSVNSIYADEVQPAAPLNSTPVWYGLMDVGIREFRFMIQEFTTDDGTVAHRLMSLDEGSQKFALDRFDLTDDALEFALKVTKASYSGTRSEDGNSIAGRWKQGGAEYDLKFTRMDAMPVDAPDETWAGELDAVLQKLELQVRIYAGDGDSERVLLDSVTQKAGGFKAVRDVKGDAWTIRVPALQAEFTGTLSDDEQQLVGTFTQVGQPFELTLSRREHPVSHDVPAPPRPQEPKPPFPYDLEEVAFDNTTDSVRIAGTLTIPRQQESVPAVVMITGSGPQDRDESIAGHKPFWVIADHLSRHGIAVLRCDDRGVGQSTGDVGKATSEDFARDAAAAVEFLQQHPRIDRTQVGLIGHSEGGLIAPMVAAEHPDVAFIVLLAGTGVDGERILLSQGRLILQAAGVTDEPTLENQKAVQIALIHQVLSAAEGDSNDRLVTQTLEELKSKLPSEHGGEEALEATVRAGIERLRTPWFEFFLKHEPAPVLKKVKCPVLALNGEKDIQVDPKLNLPSIEQALTEGGNSRFETVELPKLNHLFQTSETGSLGEYSEIEETVAVVALDRITDWIRQVTVPAPN